MGAVGPRSSSGRAPDHPRGQSKARRGGGGQPRAGGSGAGTGHPATTGRRRTRPQRSGDTSNEMLAAEPRRSRRWAARAATALQSPLSPSARSAKGERHGPRYARRYRDMSLGRQNRGNTSVVDGQLPDNTEGRTPKYADGAKTPNAPAFDSRPQARQAIRASCLR